MTNTQPAVVQKKLFYPEKGGGGPRAAKKICARCPVRAECLTDALTRRDLGYGVLGGTTPRERRELLQAGGAHHERRSSHERRWVA